MKNITNILIVVCFISSCSYNNNSRMYINYTLQFSNEIETIRENEKKIFLYFKYFASPGDFKDEAAFSPIEEEARNIFMRTEQLISQIEYIKKKVLETDSITEKLLNNKQHSNYSFSEKDLDKLKKAFVFFYNTTLDSRFIPDNENFKHRQTSFLKKKQYIRLSALKGNISSSVEIIALLTMMQFYVKHDEYKLLLILLKYVEVEDTYFKNLKKAYVEPNAKELKVGTEFTAKVFLAPVIYEWDSFLDISADGKQLQSKHQHVTYTKKIVSNDTGRVTVKCIYKYFDKEFPFQFDYYVKK